MSFIKRFTQWQNYAHYILLGLGISVVATYYGAPIDTQMTLIVIAALFILDSLIHGIFWILPKPYRWRD